MFRVRLVSVALAATLIVALVPVGASAVGTSGTWVTTQVTDNEFGLFPPEMGGGHIPSDNDEFPKVSGDRIAWAREAWNDQSGGLTFWNYVCTWEDGDAEPTVVGSCSKFDGGLQMSGDRLVWQDFEGVLRPLYDIYTWTEGDTSPTRMSESGWEDKAPQVSGDLVAWLACEEPVETESEFIPAGDDEVFVRTVGDAAPTRITNNDYRDYGVVVSGDRIAWLAKVPPAGIPEVFTWAVGDAAPTQVTNEGALLQSGLDWYWHAWGLQISGDRLAWVAQQRGEFTGKTEIFTWTEGDTARTRLTDNFAPKSDAQVSGNRVVWLQDTLTGTHDIYAWNADVTAPTAVVSDDTRKRGLRLSGDRLVWYVSDETDQEIHTWKFGDSAPTPLTNNAVNDTNPAVSGDRIAWQHWDGDDPASEDWEIYTSVPANPSQDIADLIESVDEAITAGTLAGTGRGVSAHGRLAAFENMLVSAEASITAGDYAGAVNQLKSAYAKCDGNPLPPDFVTGTSREAIAADLAALITKLEALVP